jgi:hypothetical protein
MILLNLIDRYCPSGAICCLFVHSTLIEAACSSETLLLVYCWTAWCYIPDDGSLGNSALWESQISDSSPDLTLALLLPHNYCYQCYVLCGGENLTEVIIVLICRPGIMYLLFVFNKSDLLCHTYLVP